MIKITAQDMLDVVMGSDGKWLLIGATRAGRSLYRELQKRNRESRIRLWIDKKYDFYRLCGLPVCNSDALDGKPLQGVILSSDFVEKYYRSVSERIPKTIPVYELIGEAEGMADFPWTDPKYTDVPPAPGELILVNPVDLLKEDRLDIIIRYMACKEILGEKSNDGMDRIGAYKKLIESMNDGEEFVRPFTTSSYFSDYKEKKGAANFLEAFKALMKSMQSAGFSPKHFIPLSETRGVINGAHRTAVALALGINVYAKIYVGFGEPFLSFRKKDLSRLGFTDVEIDAVEKTYIQLKNSQL